MEHEFTSKIKEILNKTFSGKTDEIFSKSYLIKYLNKKTVSAMRGSKSRGSFGNHYAVYVLVEDYINQGYDKQDKDYTDYEGAMYKTLLERMRSLPFGQKLQNHALNHRMNKEFEKMFSDDIDYQPIMRDLKTKRYWINENLLKIKLSDNSEINIAQVILNIIDAYVQAKRSAFEHFIQYCINLTKVSDTSNEAEQKEKAEEAKAFVFGQIQPNIDARIFEIVSYAILKAFYAEQVLYWGWLPEELTEENLKLYKTGRTNANDGGIDFVMKPLGRFFQVTETLDVKKYFLDIDKIQRYPVTFVIKTEIEQEEILKHLEANAQKIYGVKKIVERYMEAIEEVINIPRLKSIFEEVIGSDKLNEVIDEIVIQSKLEFNYEEDDIETDEIEEDIETEEQFDSE